MTILTRSKVDEGGGKSTLRRDKKVSREADLNHRPKDDYEHATTVLRSNGSDEIIIYHHLPRTVIVEKYKY
jgi:hypothetical protein